MIRGLSLVPAAALGFFLLTGCLGGPYADECATACQPITDAAGCAEIDGDACLARCEDVGDSYPDACALCVIAEAEITGDELLPGIETCDYSFNILDCPESC